MDADGPILRTGELYWKKTDDAEWTLGRVRDIDTENVNFELVDEVSGHALPNEPVQLPLAATTLASANPLFVYVSIRLQTHVTFNCRTYPDMTSLRYMNEPALVKNLYDRWIHDDREPYTRVSNILIAVNPLQYLEKLDKEPFVRQSLDKSPPHPYHIAENAYRQMRSVKQNQSIIISGESGSGKTETSKIILDFLTNRSAFNTAGDENPAFSNQDEMSQISQFAPNQDDESAREHALGDRLMESIPILESFGNAKTHRNHNSSRFGKYMRLQFSRANVGNDLHLTGASIDTYLLETSRLVQTPTGERNFHVFYELLRSGDDKYLEELKLVPNPYMAAPKKGDATVDDWIAQYHYLNRSGCTSSGLTSDRKNFQKLLDALDFVNISSDEVLRVVSGLLHLGNVEFDEEDTNEGTAATVSHHDETNSGALKVAAELLGLDPDDLMDAILKKRISRMANDVGAATNPSGRPGLSRAKSVYFSPKDVTQASYSRDTIAKIIYDHVFGALMRQCADALAYNVAQKDELPYIGVLDIFGFEDFEPKNRNSLEQLMINYANETLQNMFNQCILKNEYELYHLENIFAPQNAALRFPIFKPVPHPSGEDKTTNSKHLVVTYEDNKDCLALISAKNEGMFAVMETSGKLAGQSDRVLLGRFNTLFKQNACYIAPHAKDAKHTFIIKHFAGPVRYNITGFLDKNNNVASTQFDDLIQSSSLKLLNMSLTKPDESAVRRRGGVAVHKPAGSVTQIFSNQMKTLSLELGATRNNFIRCIKPNAAMDPAVFDRASVVQQLRCSGTVQACQVLQVGLPTRVSYEELIDTYIHLLGMDFMMQFHENGRLFARALCYVLEFPTDDYRLGDTKLFFKTGKIHLLDTVLNVTPVLDAEELETRLLKYIVKRRWITAVTKVVVRRHMENIFLKVRLARRVIMLQCWVRQVLARKLVQQMRTRQRLQKTWGRFCSKLYVRAAFDGSVDDKLILLQSLLRQKETSPDKKWLLTWLGPLQRSMYVQKLGKTACVTYLAKRAFLSLLEKVREQRACVKLQSQFRRVLATKQYDVLRAQRRAQEHWRTVRNWVKGRFCFMAMYRRAHLLCLERDNLALRAEIARLSAAQEATTEKLAAAEATNAALTSKQAEFEAEVAKCNATITVLETKEMETQMRYQMAQELVDVETAKSSNLEDVNDRLSQANEALREALDDANAALDAQTTESNVQILELKTQTDKLAQEYAHAQAEIRAKLAHIAETEGKNVQLSQANENLTEKSEELAKSIADGERKQNQLEDVITRGNLQICELSNQLQNVQDELDFSSREIVNLKQRVEAYESANAQLQATIAMLTEELEIARVTALQSEKVDLLEAQVAHLQNELKEARKQDKNLKDKLFTLKRQASVEKINPASINMEVIELTTKLAQRESQVTLLTGQVQQLQASLSTVETKITDTTALEASLAERENKIDTLKTLLKQTQIKKEKLLHEAKSSQVVIDLVKRESQEREDQIRDEFLETIALLKDEIAALKKHPSVRVQQEAIPGPIDTTPREDEQSTAEELICSVVPEAPVHDVDSDSDDESLTVTKKSGPYFEAKTTASLAVVLTAVVVREYVKSRFGYAA
ncbi:Aste57867_11219 [Aphanomyces stellatus]|uniref:Aste57867_11219 protein n=1 Tax=Aphanomyces stellatus TaxID=120398 RepID=A0A485KSB2_9STRA|nr:hypothetical protein As57867_011177 [Aphanomyces stellatus]VFT88085.1 Aste57867_11219 [Aphanomyces stellatus]